MTVLLTLLAGCGGEAGPDGRDPGNGDIPEPMPVQTMVVGQRTESASFGVAGVVAPLRRARMGTRQAGNVEQVMVDAGEAVEAGQAILRVDARDLKATLHAARLQRQAATAAWETAQRNRQRFRRLYHQDLIARARLEEVELAAEDARAQLEQAKAEVAAVEINLDYATLRAPFGGVVSEVLTDVGTFVAPGPPLVVLEDRSRLEINVGVGQASAAGLVAGDTLEVRADGLERILTARIQAILPALEAPGVGQVLRLVVDGPPPGLEPGMIAEVRLPAPRAAQSFVVIPASALLRRGQLDGVFVVDDGADEPPRARLRWVGVAPTTAPADAGNGGVRVLRGLAPGDRVVVGDAVDALADGQPVVLARP